MKESKLLIGITVLLGIASGCAHQVTPEEIHAKSEQSAANGRDKFHEEMVQKNVTWYVYGGQPFTGFNRATGLPEQLISSGPAEFQNADFAKGHNDAILSYMATDGLVPGSFTPWENDLYHQASFFETHSDQKPMSLKAGQPVTSPGGKYTLSIERSGASSSPITQSAYQLSVHGPDGAHQSATPAGASEPTAEVLFGPNGSDIAFTRWPSTGGQPVYAAVNLRDGRYLVVQHGQ
jgi:hypothetical protein